MELQYTRFVDDVGCSNSSSGLACLQSADLTMIQEANVLSALPNVPSDPLPLWYFLPIIDGEMVQGQLHKLFDQGKTFKIPVLPGRAIYIRISAIFDVGFAGDSETTSYNGINANVLATVMDYWIRVMKVLDPNTLKRGHAPRWESWTPDLAQRLKIQTQSTAM
ncbi:hypothetical protein AtubIFM56815_007028 [Aspergillus tubingensis]|uniref:Uncharacterized protein n=1 Tax=Aspergillus tubingensis TaxID=5068 RepID=A0A9W6AKR9_ASPTU|nr:hypothetical protein AtubIFM56815_007028 [Aspergillus tubingensis]